MIVGAAIAPHGSLILPVSSNEDSQASKIHQSMEKLALYIQKLNPDIIFLSSPHGIALETNFGFYKNEKAQGTASWHDEYQEFNSVLKLNSKLTSDLLKFLQKREHRTEGIMSYTASEPSPLRWGEVVPTWFLRNISAEYVILTQPSRRYEHALDMIPELEKFGQDLGSYLHNLPLKVFILISGDMAHTYQEDGPYGIHPSAQPFDNEVEKWANTLEKKYLVENAGSMLYSALACGFTGFVFLDSLMRSLKVNIKSEVLCNLHPTYYGMMVAKFEFL